MYTNVLLFVPLVLGMLSGRICTMTSAPEKNNPLPGPVFAIAWTLLYLALGLFAVRVVKKVPMNPRGKLLLALLALNLLFNFAWSPAFSCGGTPGKPNALRALYIMGAVVTTALMLWGAALKTSQLKWEHLLIAPYVAWLVIATVLNVNTATALS